MLSQSARPRIESSAASLLSPELMTQLEHMELVSRKIFRGRFQGERRSRRQGQSVEFADYRSYVSGDDLRFVDWNLYARLDRLFLKLFLEEEDLRFFTLIDASTSMDFGNPNKLQYAKQLAAALAFVGLCRADQVRVAPLSNARSGEARTLRGRHQVWRMLRDLEAIQAGQNVSLTEGLKTFCLRTTGKGIVVLISDLLDKEGYESGLRYLLAHDLDIYVVHVLSPEELQPTLQGDLQLVDCEDDDKADITISKPLLDQYQRTLAAFRQGARDFCLRRGIAYLPASTAHSVQSLVLGYLRERGLVR